VSAIFFLKEIYFRVKFPQMGFSQEGSGRIIAYLHNLFLLQRIKKMKTQQKYRY